MVIFSSEMNETGMQEVHRLALIGKIDVLMNELKKEDVNACDMFGRTPFLYALLGGHLTTAQYLYAQGSDALVQTKSGSTALHLAAECGNEDICEWLVKDLSADIFTSDKIGRTPLHVACMFGNQEVAKYLIQIMRDNEKYISTIRAANGDTPLHLAAAGGHVSTLTTLFPLMRENIVDSNAIGWTPLHSASAGGHLEAVACLLTHGADPSTLSMEGEDCSAVAERCGWSAVVAGIAEFRESGVISSVLGDGTEKPVDESTVITPQSRRSGVPGSDSVAAVDDEAQYATDGLVRALQLLNSSKKVIVSPHIVYALLISILL